LKAEKMNPEIAYSLKLNATTLKRPLALQSIFFLILIIGIGHLPNQCFAQDGSSAEPATEGTVNDKIVQPLTINAEHVLIEEILTKQTKAWNDGDLEKFMQTYWKSDKLTFSSGGKTTYGWQPTLDNYKNSYPTKEKMGQLHFDGLEITTIESNSALVLGNWHLKINEDTLLDGNFSLVVKKLDDQWKIIHDHSSALDEKLKKKKNQ